MRSNRSSSSVAARDRALRVARRMVRGSVAGALGLTAVLSVAAAQSFKGHQRSRARVTAPPATVRRAGRAVQVPAPQPVPQISGAPPVPQAPAQAPTDAAAQAAAAAQAGAVPVAPEPAPTVSGGS